MTPEERDLLKRTYDLAEENNKILRKMYNSIRWQRIMSTVYWIFIIGSAIGAYYLIQPYIDALTNAYTGVKGGINTSVGGINDYLNLLN